MYYLTHEGNIIEHGLDRNYTIFEEGIMGGGEIIFGIYLCKRKWSL